QHHRPRGHEIDEAGEERFAVVLGVELLALLAGEQREPSLDDPEALLLHVRENLAGEVTTGRVRLDDEQGAFDGQRFLLRVSDGLAADALCGPGASGGGGARVARARARGARASRGRLALRGALRARGPGAVLRGGAGGGLLSLSGVAIAVAR